MPIRAEQIFLSNKVFPKNIEGEQQTSTDVIVQLQDGKKYVASFFTFLQIEKQRAQAKKEDFLGGKYFWEKNMILIDSCNENNIKLVVNHLLEEGDFLDVFEKI